MIGIATNKLEVEIRPSKKEQREILPSTYLLPRERPPCVKLTEFWLIRVAVDQQTLITNIMDGDLVREWRIYIRR